MLWLRRIGRRIISFFKGMKPGRVKTLLYAGFIALMLGLIGFSVYQVARHMTVGLNTLRTQEITDESYVQMQLYLFRDEQALAVGQSNTYLYNVQDGERVGVGQTLATAYTVEDAAKAEELQRQLDAYGKRIALLRELGGAGTPSDARDVYESIDKQYLALLEAAGRGDLSAVGGYADSMLDGLGRYDVLTGEADKQTVAQLEAERAALLTEYAATPVGTRTTDKSGYFYYDCDGYESIFDYDAVMTMTPDEFKTMTARSVMGVPTGVCGKMVYSPTWYAAAYLPLSDGAVEVFRQAFVPVEDETETDSDAETDPDAPVEMVLRNRTYTVRCIGEESAELSLTIVNMVFDEEGALVVFRSEDMPVGFDFSRCFSVELVSSRVSGYRIPKEAVVTLKAKKTGETVEGVYILAGNVVEFRKIRVRDERDGYVIAESYEDVKAYLDALAEEDPEAYRKATADGWSYLSLNDNIITSGNELYEGKVIG